MEKMNKKNRREAGRVSVLKIYFVCVCVCVALFILAMLLCPALFAQPALGMAVSLTLFIVGGLELIPPRWASLVHLFIYLLPTLPFFICLLFLNTCLQMRACGEQIRQCKARAKGRDWERRKEETREILSPDMAISHGNAIGSDQVFVMQDFQCLCVVHTGIPRSMWSQAILSKLALPCKISAGKSLKLHAKMQATRSIFIHHFTH